MKNLQGTKELVIGIANEDSIAWGCDKALHKASSSEIKEDPLWKPDPLEIQKANLTHFIAYVNHHYQTTLSTFDDLHAWSVTYIQEFWCSVWDFCGLISSQEGQKRVQCSHGIFKPQFFSDAKLNYAQNLLRPRPSGMPTLLFWGEDKVKRTLTYGELYKEVSRLTAYLKSLGVQKGDCVAGYVPNTPEAVIAMLAATSLGAIWSSCSPDFGVSGVLDRFGQITPKILFMADGYYYNCKRFDCLEKVDELYEGLPSLKKIIVFPYGDRPLSLPSLPFLIDWAKALEPFRSVQEIDFVQVPFNHPAFILYSSGTTGIPKCIVHGVGGTLLQHFKEHQLHCDIKPGDRVFYFTTCGWMMWNWQVSALASGATLLLYDGSPAGPILWQYAEAEKMTFMGISAKYIDCLRKAEIYPKDKYDLSNLRMIGSTGSPLVPESFDFVYEHISSNICLASISGGTDIISCFALGNPLGPVWRGELQAPGLGMDVQVFDETGHTILSQKGEFVCTTPFPSMPLFFWEDVDDQKYHAAYFEKFPNVWCHGDYAEHTTHGGFIIYGRSDTVLNPGGVRIGTAEIYRQVEQIPEVLESLVVGQDWQSDVRVILFLKLKEGLTLSTDLIEIIRKQIRLNTTPRHIPAKVIQVKDIPRTKSGKIVELAVREVIHQRPMKNIEALANPETLKLYKNLKELQEG
ncbi:MAG TPA: acetoacetate--CoA ligase [Alphaproteobacteria bacterium]|nr:acetoacetate--CoA ligase [Alphaproteobacteria bacterium]